MQRLVDVVPQYRLPEWCCHPCVPPPQRRSASACASGLPQSQSGLLLAGCAFATVLAALSLHRHPSGRAAGGRRRSVAKAVWISYTRPSALLVDRGLFLKHLNGQGYSLLWIVTGEKAIITGNIPREDD